MNILFYIMLIVFVSYISFIWNKYGVLTSVSASYERLPEKLKPLFTFFCWGFALPALIIGFTLSENSVFQFLMFFAGGGILFVGAAPDIVFNKLENKVHMISAVVAIVTFYLYALLVFTSLWYITVPFIILNILMVKLKNRVWWIEILAFSLITILFKIMI